ncbi:hypothetical protein PBI_LEMURIA_46 [Mycobacterium phage Lemuria]|uniref:Uncharacterized protein n=1 Tax=Mycobacterium phage Lemuria TaxID=2599868 RepID=A0A5J6THJ3_9CAUD|nr:hypothetical protein KDW76_gp46 [Mycobacterium phage Lemuria]QFG10126.1 hypothetical protein PBI_LEMURIA_46 [Mycobacterium phage Lemuria]
MFSTDDERDRDTALRLAIQNDPGAQASVIVEDAEAFRAFLAGEPTKTEGK